MKVSARDRAAQGGAAHDFIGVRFVVVPQVLWAAAVELTRQQRKK